MPPFDFTALYVGAGFIFLALPFVLLVALSLGYRFSRIGWVRARNALLLYALSQTILWTISTMLHRYGRLNSGNWDEYSERIAVVAMLLAVAGTVWICILFVQGCRKAKLTDAHRPELFAEIDRRTQP